jgi:hypothetical protein
MNVGLPLPIVMLERKLVSGSYEITSLGRQQAACVDIDPSATATAPKFIATQPGRYFVILQCPTNNEDTKLELVAPSAFAREAEYNTIRFDQYMEASVSVNWSLVNLPPLTYVISGTTLNSWSKMARQFNLNVASCPFLLDLETDDVAEFLITGTSIQLWQLFIYRLGNISNNKLESLNLLTKNPTKLDDGGSNVTVTKINTLTPRWRASVSGSPTNVKLRWAFTRLAFAIPYDDQFDSTRDHTLRLRIWKIAGQSGGGNVRLRWRRNADAYLHDVSCDIPTGDDFNETTVTIAASSALSLSDSLYLSIEEIANGDGCEIEPTIIPS